MQTITKANLDPEVDDTRNLQAEQEFCGAIGWFGLITQKTLSNPSARLRTRLSLGSVPQSSDPNGLRHR
jgi:hypothetical protein